MKKKLLVLAMALLMLAGTAACGDGGADGLVDSVVNRLSGNVTGEVAKTYQTEWFQFQVNSLEAVESYKGVEAGEGNLFLVANVYEKNTWSAEEDIPMSCYDFFIYEDDAEDPFSPEEPWDEAMMPNEFYLAAGEEATYDVVFTVLDSVEVIQFVYEEVDDQGDTHNTFTIQHSLEV